MGYRIDWIIPRLRNTGILWNCASSITVAVVGIFSKFLVVWLNKATVYNRSTIIKALQQRPRHVPLLTISNHHSCFDDPGLWGILNLSTLVSKKKMRWSLAAHDICFTNPFHSYFFMLGKCIPVVRGDGVYQPAIDFCLERMTEGEWVHIFPEGRVNMTIENGLREYIRFKWGIGRLVYDSPVLPIIIPIWHEGFDEILPNCEPYIFKFRKKVTLNFGSPINLQELLDNLKNKKATPEEARKCITDRLQEELFRLRDETKMLMKVS